MKIMVADKKGKNKWKENEMNSDMCSSNLETYKGIVIRESGEPSWLV